MQRDEGWKGCELQAARGKLLHACRTRCTNLQRKNAQIKFNKWPEIYMHLNLIQIKKFTRYNPAEKNIFDHILKNNYIWNFLYNISINIQI